MPTRKIKETVAHSFFKVLFHTGSDDCIVEPD